MTVVVIILIIFIVLILLISYLLFYISYNRYAKKELILNNKVNKHKNEEEYVLETDWFNKLSKEVEIISDDNLKLKGYILNNKNNKWMIIVHGFTSSHEAMVNIAKKFYEMKYNVLVVDLRAHGNSEGTYITMGVKDCLDIKKWINYLVDNDAKEIGLFGISMGAATVMNTIGLDLPKEVKFAIEDCGYTSVKDELVYQQKMLFHLPKIPFLYISMLYAIIFAKYNIDAYTPLKSLQKTNIPLLLIHGDKDTFVPFEMVNKLDEVCNSKHQKLIIKGATHARSCVVDSEKYWNTVTKFIENIKKEK